MKWNKFFMLGVAGLALCACSNEDNLAVGGDDGNAKSLVISISGISSSAGTKADADDMAPGWVGDETNQGVNNVGSITLFFTDGTGAVKYTYQADATTTNTTNFNALKTNGVKFVGLEGVTAVYAVANKTISDLQNVKSISSLNTLLSTQGISLTGKDKVVYAGGTTDITPLVADNASDGLPLVDINNPENSSVTAEPYSYKAEINLVPIISRIQIKSIKVHSSGETATFPTEAIGNVAANSLKMTWSNFKPTLYGVYLNRFPNQFNDLLGTVAVNPTTAATSGYLYNESYASAMTGGKWTFGTTPNQADMTEDAAYIGYETDAYVALAQWGTESAGYCTLDMGQTQVGGEQKDNCIAFNIFVPFEVASEGNAARKIDNPKIHFQFDKTIGTTPDNYKIEFKHATGGTSLTDEEESVANSSEYNVNYTMPTTDKYLFANISKLYSEDSGNTGQASDDELVLEPGKIYNMNVVIEPVNMTVDLETPTSYNVIVKITVQDFTEENIYPGFE